VATLVVEPNIERSVGRTREHLFFTVMSGIIALIVFIGFAGTYYLAGVFHAKPLAAPIVRVHGAVFTSWIALLIVQTSLVGTGYGRAHRRLGLVSLGLAPLVVVLGALVAIEMVKRFAAVPGVDSPLIFAVALSEITGFAVPVFFALRLRRRPASHKRLIMIGTIAMTTAGFGRWPIPFLLHKPLPAMLCAFTLLASMMVFDVVSTRRLQPVTAWGSAWVVCIELGGFAAGHTAAWHAFAAYVRSLPVL
jgi:hypothetical protein